MTFTIFFFNHLQLTQGQRNSGTWPFISIIKTKQRYPSSLLLSPNVLCIESLLDSFEITLTDELLFSIITRYAKCPMKSIMFPFLKL